MTTTLSKTKVCRDCGEAKPLDEFHRHARTRDRRQVICKACMLIRNRDWKARNPEKLAAYERNRVRTPEQRRAAQLRREYGIEPAEYAALVEKQRGRCAICGIEPVKVAGRRVALYVDHDHKTGAVRGLLCNGCNLALGHMDDDVERLNAAIKYLEESGC